MGWVEPGYQGRWNRADEGRWSGTGHSIKRAAHDDRLRQREAGGSTRRSGKHIGQSGRGRPRVTNGYGLLRLDYALTTVLVDQLQGRLFALCQNLDICRVGFAADKQPRTVVGGTQLDFGSSLRIDRSSTVSGYPTVPSGILKSGSAGWIWILARTRPRSSTISSARPRSTGNPPSNAKAGVRLSVNTTSRKFRTVRMARTR